MRMYAACGRYHQQKTKAKAWHRQERNQIAKSENGNGESIGVKAKKKEKQKSIGEKSKIAKYQ